MYSNFEKIYFRGRDFWLLRDDRIAEDFNGNKARKLEYLLKADLSIFSRIISCGSNQSNAMYSISVLAKLKNLEFIYVTDHISSYLEQNPCGNFALALQNGMRIMTNSHREKFAMSLKKDSDIFLPEGISTSLAEQGFKTQADQIEAFAKNSKLKFDIFLPSGTGTSAAYLAKNCKFKVFTTPCAGDVNYLRKLILSLDENSKVEILNPPKKYHFGDIKIELFEIYKELKETTKVEFELLYDSVGWLSLLSNLDKFNSDILYIHQGGLTANESLLERYKYKFSGYCV